MNAWILAVSKEKIIFKKLNFKNKDAKKFSSFQNWNQFSLSLNSHQNNSRILHMRNLFKKNSKKERYRLFVLHFCEYNSHKKQQ
jgi:hypothetical protein